MNERQCFTLTQNKPARMYVDDQKVTIVHPSGNPKWQPNSLDSIINQIKSVCTKRIRAAGNTDFAWQPRFYNHIIRDQDSLQNIRR